MKTDSMCLFSPVPVTMPLKRLLKPPPPSRHFTLLLPPLPLSFSPLPIFNLPALILITQNDSEETAREIKKGNGEQ